MTDTAIEAIYLALQKFDLGKVRCRGLDDVKLDVNIKELPLRMLLPNTSGEQSFAVAIGSLSEVTWAVTDLCLWAPLSSGGRRKYAGPMIRYCKAYLDQVRQTRNPTNLSEIVGVTFDVGPQPWADGDYWAVETQLAIREVF